MEISNSGRIVVIDDNYKEAFPLMEMLGKECLPYMYYDGKPENLPTNPPCGIRLVFLDIELQGMKGQNDKTKASGLTVRLKKIISDQNGPYIIVFWTKHQELIELIIKNCQGSNIPPVAWIDLEKSECLNNDNTYDIQEIKRKIQEKLQSIGAFKLYVEWENTVNLATKDFISEFTTLVEFTDPASWSENTASLFYQLYMAYGGEIVNPNDEEKFKYASHLINRSFLDTLENKTATHLTFPGGFELTERAIDGNTRSKLNTSLFLEKNLSNKPNAGFVYPADNEPMKTALKKSCFKKEQEPSKCQLCKIIITPECDLANDKTIKIKGIDALESPLHRVIYGLFYQVDSDNLKEEGKKFNDKGKDARFFIGPVWFDEMSYWLVLHFLTLSSLAEEEFKEEPYFSIKRDLLFDIQSKAANHVNRLGNFQL